MASKKKVSKKRASKRRVVIENPVECKWHEAVEIDPAQKAELNWLYVQLQRIGVRSISDLENLIARAE